VSTVHPTQFTTEAFFDVPGMVPGFNPDRTNKVNTLALFLENRTRLTAPLALVTGLRHDRIELEGINHRTATATNPAYFKNTYQPTTGRLGLVYDLTPHANVYVQYSTAADPPAGILTIRELSLPPASSSRTDLVPSSVRRLASTQPAEPAPMMM